MSKDYKKLYEQALSKARTFSQRWQGIEVTDSELALQELKEIFPELKESEDDRIRKSLINFLDDVWHRGKNANFDKYSKADCADWMEWVEKRGEQKKVKNIENEYVDLALPSGTLWKSVNEKGYYTFDEAVEKFGNQLPSKEQWGELKDKCNWEWKGDGCKVIGLNGKSIFLPAAGFRARPDVYEVGSTGHYWSCTSDDVEYAYNMYFDKNCIYVNYDYRCLSCSVRLVK